MGEDLAVGPGKRQIARLIEGQEVETGDRLGGFALPLGTGLYVPIGSGDVPAPRR